jgi:serpin B
MTRLTALALALLLVSPMILHASAQEEAIPDLVAGNSQFALDLYGELSQATDGNLVFSPFSVSQALAMTHAGAEGPTAAQMADTLSFGLPEPGLHETFSALGIALVARGTDEGDPEQGVSAKALHIANALWGEQTYPFADSFSDRLASDYGAALQETDFVGAPDAARDEINDWVADQTEERIQDIVPEGAITPDTRLVLANAAYFYGAWQETFDPGATSDEEFNLLDGSTVPVPLMFQQTELAYVQGDGYQIVELPYDRSGLAFTVILPDEGQFEAVESRFSEIALDGGFDHLDWTEVRLYLPSFQFEYAAGLGDTLQAMGMTDAFDPDLADFTGMIDGEPPGPLSIGDVLHKAFISLDEEGTEATAATVVIMVEGAAPPSDPVEPVEVRIDRPFLFAIRDTESGTLLFLGRVLSPVG